MERITTLVKLNDVASRYSRTITTLSFLLLFFPALAQTFQPIVYFDKDWNPINTSANAVYYRRVESKDGRFLVKDYYLKNDSLQMEAWCSKVKPDLVRDGDGIWYYPDGKIERTGAYRAEKPVGVHKHYHRNGQPKLELHYRGDEVLYAQSWDKDGKPEVVNGTGQYTEMVEARQVFVTIELMDSVIVNSYSVNRVTQDTTYTVIDTAPEFKGGFPAFYKQIAATMAYPKEARRARIDGKVFIEFVVNKEGNIQDARVLKGIGGGCDEEALNAITKQNGWKPGTRKGKPVSVRMVLPITFRL